MKNNSTTTYRYYNVKGLHSHHNFFFCTRRLFTYCLVSSRATAYYKISHQEPGSRERLRVTRNHSHSATITGTHKSNKQANTSPQSCPHPPRHHANTFPRILTSQIIYRGAKTLRHASELRQTVNATQSATRAKGRKTIKRDKEKES